MFSVQSSPYRVLSLFLLLLACASARAQEVAPDGERIVGPYLSLFGYTASYRNADGTYGPMYYAIDPDRGIVRKIGPNAFPFPIDAAYDPIGKVRFSLDDSGVLWTTDLLGTSVFVGSTGIGRSTLGSELAYQSSTGKLFTIQNGDVSSVLYETDPVTAQTSVVIDQSWGGQLPICWANGRDAIYALAQGPLYAALSIDPSSGNASYLGIPDPLAGGSGVGLSLDGAGILYALSYDVQDQRPPELICWPAKPWSPAAATDYLAIPLHGDIGLINRPLKIFFAPAALEHH